MEEGSQELEHISEILPCLFSEDCIAEWRELPEPPYDSPIETIFAEHCFRYLSPNVHTEKQVEVSTKHGSFRVDFGLSVANKRIAVECDGKDFHEGLRDEFRDAILLGENHFDTIYHFRGCDLVYYPYDCIWLISILDGDLFNQRAHLQLDKLRCSTFDVSSEKAEKDESFVFNIDPPTQYFWAFRRSASLVSKNPTLNYHWKVLYKFACEYPGSSLDELLDIRVSSWALDDTPE